MPILSVDQALDAVCAVLEAQGVSSFDALVQANHLVEADLRGHHSHGIQRLPVLAGRLQNGLTNPVGVPRAIQYSPVSISVEGDNSLGPVAANKALQEVSTQAEEYGVAVAAIRDCGHLGMLAPYVESLAQRGLIGIAFSISEALVHPLGAMRALMGTNPLAIALPTGPEPFVFDMATSAMSMGEVLERNAAGRPLADGMAIDAEGVPTNDPASALTGALSPFGGYKGFGLGLAIELLVPLLTGSAIGTAVNGTLDVTHVCNKGDVLIAIQPLAFGIDNSAAVSGYLEQVAGEMGGGGYSPPGRRSRELRDGRLKNGIPIAASTWAHIQNLHPLATDGRQP